MAIITSISGIRGTIGGEPGKNLTPIDAVKFASAYGQWLKNTYPNQKLRVVIGRDARISGAMLQNLVTQTLNALGINTIDLGLSTTPTVEVAVPNEQAQGGIILTASHNPKEWNALKLLNHKGEFINDAEGKALLQIAEAEAFSFAEVDHLGTNTPKTDYMDWHIEQVLALDNVLSEAIRQKKFKIAVDGINSTGGIIIPNLLNKLGAEVVELNGEPTGNFAHNPEPLKAHLEEICQKVIDEKADLGIVVDPDVDRLAFITERGEMFGEEYTLVAVADYLLSKNEGACVSNLSSSRALRDVAHRYGCDYFASAVGEVNVVEKMKAVDAVIGGEGNGGIIYPKSHYGRDALVGIVFFLSLLTERNINLTDLKQSYPAYFMSKKKIALHEGFNVDQLLESMQADYVHKNPTTIDGLKIDFEDSWVHLRKSNTEPIVRIYTEAPSQAAADSLADRFIAEMQSKV
ncbi:MAG: phosphoglucosamine mutase [Flavobacteriaceae bacterium]|nr:phosphoglucosamine mutase [Flavobacteriaceae bacterium]